MKKTPAVIKSAPAPFTDRGCERCLKVVFAVDPHCDDTKAVGKSPAAMLLRSRMRFWKTWQAAMTPLGIHAAPGPYLTSTYSPLWPLRPYLRRALPREWRHY